MAARREVERVNAALGRLSKEKEILTQDKGELVVQVTATGKLTRDIIDIGIGVG